MPERSRSSLADGRAVLPLDLIRGKRFAYNSLDSMSGIIALTRDLEAPGESLDIFSERIETGAHRASIVAVAEGRADVCADRLPQLGSGAALRAARARMSRSSAGRRGARACPSSPRATRRRRSSQGCAPRSRALSLIAPASHPRDCRNLSEHVGALPGVGSGRKEDMSCPEQILLPMLGVFGALVVATVVAYVLLNNDDLHTRGKH